MDAVVGLRPYFMSLLHVPTAPGHMMDYRGLHNSLDFPYTLVDKRMGARRLKQLTKLDSSVKTYELFGQKEN